ncbi:hypothetical protein CW306_19170 [Bacillus sp. BA3]|nr:hypothetical protein CW306_19170 [Bacillus sp. BA3]
MIKRIIGKQYGFKKTPLGCFFQFVGKRKTQLGSKKVHGGSNKFENGRIRCVDGRKKSVDG